MFKANIKIKFSPAEIAAKHAKKLQEADGVQDIFTSKVARDVDPFVPFDHGTLASSVLRASDYKQGVIVYDTPYARRLYYGASFKFSRDKHPQATHHWFDAAKARFLDVWGGYVSRLLKGAWRHE